MEDKNLLNDTYGLNVTAYFNDFATSLNELTRKTLGSFASELKKMEIFDEQAIAKGTGALDKRLNYSLNKNLDILETYAKENMFDIEDIKDQIESKSKRSKSADKKDSKGQTDAKAELENEFQEYRKERNMQMLTKLAAESKDKYQKCLEQVESQYKTSDIEAITVRNGYNNDMIEVRVKNLNTFLNERKEMSDILDSLVKN